jgi:general stress protein YciG
MSEIYHPLASQFSKRKENRMQNKPVQKTARGFAAMSLARRREVSSKGGLIAQARGTAHRWTAEEARAAGKKGSARYTLRQVQTLENVE